MTCHCERGCGACRGGACSCGLILPAQPVAMREHAGPGFTYCPVCRHAVSEGRSCLYCQVRQDQDQDPGPCGCAACTGWEPDPGQFPGSTPGAVRTLLAALESRYADAG